MRSAPASGPAKESRSSNRAATGSSTVATESMLIEAHSERLKASAGGRGAAGSSFVYSAT
jgi:hypothetical protein